MRPFEAASDGFSAAVLLRVLAACGLEPAGADPLDLARLGWQRPEALGHSWAQRLPAADAQGRKARGPSSG